MEKQKKWQKKMKTKNDETIETLHTHTHTHVHLKNEKGITLIALVVTIVVLIILALIGINAVFGEKGLIETTKYSKEEHRAGSVRDEVIEWRNEKNLAKEMGEVVKLRAELLDELIDKELLTQEERTTVEEYDEVKIASQTIVIEPDDQESLNANLTIEKKILYKNGETYKSGEVFKLGDTVTYEIVVKNIGNKTVGNIIVEDILTIKGPNRNEEIRKEFQELEDISGNKIENSLIPNQEGYIRYTYTIIQEDLGAELSNKAQVKGKNKIPPGEKPVVTPVDKPTGTLTITKTYAQSATEKAIYNDNSQRAEFKITFSDGKEYEYYYQDTTQRNKIKSGENIYIGHGEAINIIGLPDGIEYSIEETQAPEGYIKIEEEITGRINLSDGGVCVESIINEESNRDITLEVHVVDRKDEYRVGEAIIYNITVSNTGNEDIEKAYIHAPEVTNILGQVTFIDVASTVLNNNTLTFSIKAGQTLNFECRYIPIREDAGATNIVMNVQLETLEVTNPKYYLERRATSEEVKIEGLWNLTIHYVYEDTGTMAAPDVQAQYLKGESFYHVSPSISGYIANYQLLRSDKDGMPAKDITITVLYNRDTIGGPNPGIGDGIPDKYQRQVNYIAVNGTVSFSSTIVTVYDSNGNPSETGTGYLSATQIPTATPNAGYSAGQWDVMPTTKLPITRDCTFTITFTRIGTGRWWTTNRTSRTSRTSRII